MFRKLALLLKFQVRAKELKAWAQLSRMIHNFFR